MERTLARKSLPQEDRLHFEYALGKAREDEGAYEAAFGHYERGAKIRRELHPYDAGETEQYVLRCKALFTSEFFGRRRRRRLRRSRTRSSSSACRVRVRRCSSRSSQAIRRSRAPWSCPNRAGDRPANWARPADAWARRIRRCSPPCRTRRCGRWASEYLDRDPRPVEGRQTRFSSTRCRTTSCTSGLIHLILPNARIIDARRHPLACCFSGFKQHFARGQNFSYSLEDLGRYYRTTSS